MQNTRFYLNATSIAPCDMLALLSAENDGAAANSEGAIRRNIAMLLNTRCHYQAQAAARRSFSGIRSFGLDERMFDRVDSAQGQEEFRRHIENVIARYEPRLTDVLVRIDRFENGVLFFHISGVIRRCSTDRYLQLDTQLDTRRRALTLKEHAL